MPRMEEDTSPKGLGYGEEKAQKEAAYASKPVQAPFDFKFGEVPPEDFEEGPAPEELGGGPDMDIPGLGNLGEVLFAPTDRPDESPNTPPTQFAGPTWAQDSPAGPPQEYLAMLHNPAVDVRTKTLIDLVSRINLLRPAPGTAFYQPQMPAPKPVTE